MSGQAGFVGEHPVRLLVARSTLRVVDPWTGRSVVPSTRLPRPARHLAVAADQKTFCVWDVAGGLSLHDSETGALIRKFPEGPDLRQAGEIAFAPDGRLAVADNTMRRIRIYDVARGVELCALDNVKGWICDLAFDRAGVQLIAATGQGPCLSVWDAPR